MMLRVINVPINRYNTNNAFIMFKTLFIQHLIDYYLYPAIVGLDIFKQWRGWRRWGNGGKWSVLQQVKFTEGGGDRLLGSRGIGGS